MELIEREAAIDTLEKHGVATDFGTHLLRHMPTIDAAPAVHGRWMKTEYISRPALMRSLTEGSEQRKLREMTGADAYYEFVQLVNSIPAAVVRCTDGTCRGPDSDFYCADGTRMDLPE